MVYVASIVMKGAVMKLILRWQRKQKNNGVADFMYEFFLKGARSAPFKKNSYPD